MTINLNSELRFRVLLSTYEALIGKISPSIRLISIDWDIDYYAIKAYFDRPITEDDYEILKTITTEVISHFPEINKVNEFAEYSLESIVNIKALKEMVFLRYGELEI